MKKGFTVAQMVGFIALVFIGLMVFFIGSFILKKTSGPKEALQNVGVEDEKVKIILKGDFLTYAEINTKYKDKKVAAYINGKDVSNKVVVSYFQGGRQVNEVDTKYEGTFIIKYELVYENKVYKASRVVIVIDSTSPNLSVPKDTIITTDKVAFYNVTDGVLATDNSGKASFKCNNSLLPTPGNYIIECEAKDGSGNKTKRKRLIKVIQKISFEGNENVTIKYPDGDFIYKYSLDGGKTWTETGKKTTVNLKENSIVAEVFKGNDLITSAVYYKK